MNKWQVLRKKKVSSQIQELPVRINFKVYLLLRELEQEGPYRVNWPNYGMLKGRKDVYHCHIKKGNPTYVAIWQVIDKKIHILEVTYVGTHEKAPY